jgi:hypothetical protein
MLSIICVYSPLSGVATIAARSPRSVLNPSPSASQRAIDSGSSSNPPLQSGRKTGYRCMSSGSWQL